MESLSGVPVEAIGVSSAEMTVSPEQRRRVLEVGLEEKLRELAQTFGFEESFDSDLDSKIADAAQGRGELLVRTGDVLASDLEDLVAVMRRRASELLRSFWEDYGDGEDRIDEIDRVVEAALDEAWLRSVLEPTR